MSDPETAAHESGLAPGDLAADLALAQMSDSIRFLLDITPVNVVEARDAFLATGDEPEFDYRELSTDPDVVESLLGGVDLDAITDPALRRLLGARHRELRLELEMLRARGTSDFLGLSQEAYGGLSPELLEKARALVVELPPSEDPAPLDAQAFLALAQEELDRYREIEPDIGLHAEVRSDVSGVLVEGDTLMIAETSRVAVNRAQALIHHEVGTHLVTQANGVVQPVRNLGTGLAGYSETQEGLAVTAEIACGQLTPQRLRQLGARVVTVNHLVEGASFRESYEALTAVGMARNNAFTNVMRVYRAGGFVKDAIYLRGLLDVLSHIRQGGSLDLFWLGKFAIGDLPLIEDLHQRGVLRPARVTPRWLGLPHAMERLDRAANAELLTDITQDHTQESQS